MTVFISYNKADKETARLLAIATVEQGVNVWFDEWQIRPGDSITGGIEIGLSNADIFVLVWSREASKSKWVGTEIRAYLRRRVDSVVGWGFESCVEVLLMTRRKAVIFRRE